MYVGLLPPGNHSEVYIAPPPRGSKKDPSKARETTEADQVASLEPLEDSKSQPLELLKQSYGERLRVAVDTDVLRATLAGPHARVCSEQSILVYTADAPAVLNAEPNGVYGFATRRAR